MGIRAPEMGVKRLEVLRETDRAVHALAIAIVWIEVNAPRTWKRRSRQSYKCTITQ
jgi:hypothetical protein